MSLFTNVLVLLALLIIATVSVTNDNEKQKNELRELLTMNENESNNNDLREEYLNFFMSFRVPKANIDINREELLARYNQYIKNKKFLNELNSDASNPNAGGYGITQYMDWFDDEMNKLYVTNSNQLNQNINDDNINDNDHDNNYGDLKEDSYNPHCTRITNYALDNSRLRISNNWGINKCRVCKSQEKAGMCWAFAGTLEFECNACKQLNKCYEFSEQYGIDCSNYYRSWDNNKCGDGGLAENLAAYYRDYGACSKYKYGDYQNGKCYSCQSCPTANTLRSRNCYSLNTKNADMLTSAANKYAMTFVMTVGEDFKLWRGWNAQQTYKYCKYSGKGGSHAMTIIGQRYGKDFLVQNSWGCDWGNKGTIWISTDILNFDKSRCVVYNNFWFSSWYSSLESEQIEMNDDIDIDIDIEVDVNDMHMDDSVINNNNNNYRYAYFAIIGSLIVLLPIGLGLYLYGYHRNIKNVENEFQPLL